MGQNELVERIMAADRLDAIAVVKEEMMAYIQAHPDEEKQQVHQAGRRLWIIEENLRAVEAAGLPMEEVYRLRDKRHQQFLAGEPPDPWPDEWSPTLTNS